jgi:quercetin dioxygenase-like cupin family protein
MPFKVTPWREESAATEDAIRKKLEGDGFKVSAWSKNAGEGLDEQEQAYTRAFCCVKGMMRVNVPGDNDYADLLPGDRVELPPGTKHSVMVGPAGVTCLEGQK